MSRNLGKTAPAPVNSPLAKKKGGSSKAAIKAFKKKVEKEIKKRNKTFSRMSSAEKRVQIAKDVIEQLKLKKFKATPGEYALVVDNTGEYYDRDEDIYDINGFKQDRAGQELQKVVKEKEISCMVCGIGSMAIADIMRRDKCKTDEYESTRTFALNRLSPYFSMEQLDMIETAFEGRIVEDSQGILKDSNYLWEILTPLGEKCIKFHDRYKNETNRLIGIMSNIVKNGEFKP